MHLVPKAFVCTSWESQIAKRYPAVYDLPTIRINTMKRRVKPCSGRHTKLLNRWKAKATCTCGSLYLSLRNCRFFKGMRDMCHSQYRVCAIVQQDPQKQSITSLDSLTSLDFPTTDRYMRRESQGWWHLFMYGALFDKRNTNIPWGAYLTSTQDKRHLLNPSPAQTGK